MNRKLKSLSWVALSLLICSLSLPLMAQTGKTTGTPFGSGEDSIKCRKNISLFTSYAKSKDYASAYEFWKQAYDECPASSKNIYFYGAQIIHDQISHTTDVAKRKELINLLMQLYDDRAVFFGDDAKYGKDWIMSSKTTDYVSLMGKDVDYDKIYSWVKPVVDELGDNTDPQAVYYFVFSSLNKAIGNTSWHEQYVNDYMLGNAIMERSVALLTSAEDTTKIDHVLTLKSQLDELFAQSGLADCKMLNDIYGKRLEENKENVDFLQAMLDMYRYGDCEKEALYFKASKYLYAIKPTAGSAIGLAKEAMAKNQTSEATKYLQDAISLTKDKKLQGSCYTTLAIIAMNARSYGLSRSYCNQALAVDPSNGKPLILIAQMIAASASSIFPGDGVKQRCVYYLAVDKLERARSIDGRVSAEANRLIATYRKYFPSSQDIFFHPDLSQGQSIFIGGWIGESTRIR